MKKPYSIDYSIERDVDRLHAVEDILDKMPTTPTPGDLELLASYILYGKDENNQNAVQRGETTDSNRRYNSYLRTDDKMQSLDELLENSATDPQSIRPFHERNNISKRRTVIHRPKYDKDGNLVDIGDGDIPGMAQVWESIDRIERNILVNEGKMEPDENSFMLKDAYRLYQLKHMLIDIRRHQYYLKDAYKPTLHFVACDTPKAQTYDWSEDSAYWITVEEWKQKIANIYHSKCSRDLKDYETKTLPDGTTMVKWVVRRHTFDWENPFHIKQLMNYYSNIYMELQEKVDSWGRTLIYDFDRYADMCHFSPIREYILLRRIDRASSAEVAEEVEEKFGVHYNPSHIAVIMNTEIPKQIAYMAKRTRLLVETPENERKRCYRCGRMLPANAMFFVHNCGHRDGFSSTCKECERKRRVEKEVQHKNDARFKDKKVLEVPPRKID